jgi:peptidoglycan L-alanyl-D-glutamate endopeptidase CwlK
MTEADIANTNASLLPGVNPELAKACRFIIDGVRNDGYSIVVAEGYRSPEQQHIYFEQGRTTPGAIITNADWDAGKHTHGQAVDFDFVIDGVQSNADGNPWSLIGKYAHQAGLIWGGDWSSIKDYRHVEMPTSSYVSPVDGASSGSSSYYAGDNGNLAVWAIGAGIVLLLLLD